MRKHVRGKGRGRHKGEIVEILEVDWGSRYGKDSGYGFPKIFSDTLLTHHYSFSTF